ncbi:MAG: cyclopropane-fatty-acyl-phospholipid synthase family protein, partial [Candidatus Korobacteraceae bacterium]
MAAVFQIREHYDSLALIYRAFWGDHLHHGLFARGDETPEQAQLKLLEHCAGLVGGRPGGHVLDVGCGHGGTAIFLAQQYGCSVLGLTLSPRQARLAEQKAAACGVEQTVQFTVGDADSFDFGRECYDLVWTMESSEHFHDKPAYFRRIAKSLLPGGKLLVAAWTGSMQDERVREVARAFLCPMLQPADDYSLQMEAAGLTVLECQDVTSRVE